MDAKEDVRARLAIEDVIGEYVKLKRAGRSWKGLSPFTSERTPSFVVSPDKQIWHDFSSGRGGDIFTFVQEMEGVDFKAALEILARRAGIDLDQYAQSSGVTSRKSKERLYEMYELATHFYQKQFSRNQGALRYVLGARAFTKATALQWQLGYSPNTGSALLDFLRTKGFEDDEIQLAGLTSKAYRGGLQDMFRGRLQIPLCDAQGRVIGFTARLLEDNPQAPKYINTPSTPLYDKSRHVFGLHLAKDAIRKSGYVVLAEGNLDVIQSHQAGIRQVVATAGTALTEPHLKALNRLTGDIRLCFDADKAGIAATERAIPLAGQAKINLQVISIPEGKDPDELIRHDARAWQVAIEKPQYVVDWLMQQYIARVDIQSAMGKKTLSEVVMQVIKKLPDSVEQDHYLTQLAGVLEVHPDALRSKLHFDESLSTTTPRRRNQRPKEVMDPHIHDKHRTEEGLLAIALHFPKLRGGLLDLEPSMFDSEATKMVFLYLRQHPTATAEDLIAAQDIAEYVKILSLVYETLYQGVEYVDVVAEAKRLQTKLVRLYVRIQKQALIEALTDAEPQKADSLLAQARELDALLRSNQGELPGGTKEL